ncbi:MAG: FAD-binding oxidoreductase [Myxococcota bacterium]
MDAPSVPPAPPQPTAALVKPTEAEPSTIAGWGRVMAPGREIRDENLERLTRDAVLCRGLGRSYGDSSLPPPGVGAVACTTLADRILSFDPETLLMRAEAGLSLRELLRLYFPRGYFVPVTPGTTFVTLGGMVASDVHGKNHHCDGTFGEHVRSLKMRVADGTILECSPEQHPDLFWATVGGMGLTGHILEVEFSMVKVPSPWIYKESVRVPNIDEFMKGLADAAENWPMTMGWIDCLSGGNKLGRGILMRGRWATAEEAPKAFPSPKTRPAVPFVFPQFALNPLSVRAFNELYYWAHIQKEKKGIVHPEAFFWPLDAIHHWNRIYGPKGFTQYQCVLPKSAGPDAARRFLELLSNKGGASFLCVIKDCGKEGRGMLSFPMDGISIALDIAVRDDTQQLIDALNEHVIADGGRIYLTKDNFTRAEHFAAMEPRLQAFQEVRKRWDPELRFRSAQSVRMLGDPATVGEAP